MPPPEGYWQGIEALCRKYDIVLVSDEVINGFGRLGSAFGCDHYGFKPDIIVASKQITSSYMPLAAIIFTDEIYQAIASNTTKIGTFGHGFTASGHPVATAVALENLKIIEEKGLVGNAARVGRKLQAELAQLASHPLVANVRGVGLIAAVELLTGEHPRGTLGSATFAAGHENGLIIRAIGDAIAICPPLIITEAEAVELVARLKRSLDQVLERFPVTHQSKAVGL